jgi:Rod binding domain-containing protein
MTMPSEHRGHGLADNMVAQMALLAIAVAVLLVIAWYYVW